MSVVTSIILSCNFIGDEPSKELAAFIKQYSFAKVDHLAGGTKCMQTDLYISAHNYLNENQFFDDFGRLPNEDWQDLQVFFKREGDYFFSEVARKQTPENEEEHYGMGPWDPRLHREIFSKNED